VLGLASGGERWGPGGASFHWNQGRCYSNEGREGPEIKHGKGNPRRGEEGKRKSEGNRRGTGVVIACEVVRSVLCVPWLSSGATCWVLLSGNAWNMETKEGWKGGKGEETQAAPERRVPLRGEIPR